MRGAGTVLVTMNGEPVTVPAGTSITALVRQLLGEVEPKGVAVAVDRAVVPRSEWDSTTATPGAQIEVVTAAAGG